MCSGWCGRSTQDEIVVTLPADAAIDGDFEWTLRSESQGCPLAMERVDAYTLIVCVHGLPSGRPASAPNHRMAFPCPFLHQDY